MTVLPQWVGDIVSLERLRIEWFWNLNNLQEIMGCLTSLKELDIRFCDLGYKHRYSLTPINTHSPL